MAKKPLVSVKGLSIAFGKKRVVEDFDFDIAAGETVAFIGESGSGKTVSALALLKLLPPAAQVSGEINFEGNPLPDASQMQAMRGQKISIIFQEPMTALNPLHKVKKQVGEVLSIHQGIKGKARRERIQELLRLVELAPTSRMLNAYPHELSGGQRQRVMIAMALANNPRLLIADEPTTALDVTIQAQVLELLLRLQEDLGMAMLFISHDLNIVKKMAQRVYVLRGGKVMEKGLVKTVLSRPKNSYTKMLLASQPSGEPEPLKETRVLIKADQLKVWYPVRRGFFSRPTEYVKAVDGVSFQIREGETLGIVGESGSGKTTLGYALLRLVPCQGRIEMERRPLHLFDKNTMRAVRAQLQMVFQDPYGALSPRLPVGEIVGEGLRVHQPGLSRQERERRVAEALQEVGLDAGLMERYPHEFSGGQRQRIAIARALVLKPRLIVLDEPTSALDLSVQAQVVTLLKNLQKNHGLSYLFISHDLKVIRTLAHRIMVLKDGRVVEEGEARDIFKNPQTPYTRQLISSAFDLKAG